MKNLADSVLARLRNFAKARNLIYNEVLMRYILERIFYRVGASEHAGKLILKGGNLFVFWQNGFDFRPTMDADMLFRGESSPERLKEIFTEICMDESVDDGVRIDIKSIKAEQILEELQKAPAFGYQDVGLGPERTARNRLCRRREIFQQTMRVIRLAV